MNIKNEKPTICFKKRSQIWIGMECVIISNLTNKTHEPLLVF
jgi:hypothetical protein